MHCNTALNLFPCLYAGIFNTHIKVILTRIKLDTITTSNIVLPITIKYSLQNDIHFFYLSTTLQTHQSYILHQVNDKFSRMRTILLPSSGRWIIIISRSAVVV